MKKKLMLVGLVGITATLLVGAVAFEAKKSTVGTFGECTTVYLKARQEMPPVPLPASAKELLEKAEEGDWSFMAYKHWYVRQPMTLYVTDGSELAKKLTLPAKLIVFEDIRLGEIFLCTVDEEKSTWNPIASFTAPAIVDETDLEYAKLSSEEKSRELFFELSYRRVIAEITLKPASALTELLARSTPASTEGGDGGGMMMMGGPPPEFTNSLWLGIDGKKVTVYVPQNFSNRVELYSTQDLVSNAWSTVVQNLTPVFTNPVDWTSTLSGTSRFFVCGNQDIDEDGDGLPNAREVYCTGTSYSNPDTDGDGYSDGSTWPAGYSGIMRGTNDAFALDASAWRDSDEDGKPNEVVGTSTSEPPLVEDLSDYDDEDRTNDFSGNIWISADEISGLATNGAQWENLLEDAGYQESSNISDQENRANVYTMAKALVYARTGNSIYKTDVIDACSDAIDSESGGSSLALGRNLGGFIIAADLVDLPQADDMLFRDWLRTMLTNNMSDSLSLTSAHESRADDTGTHAGGARAAIAVYLQEWDELDDVKKVFKGWTGDRTSHTFTYYGTNDTWQVDTNSPVGINPKNAMIGTNSVDGVLPVAMQESGDFVWPPPQGDYAYEALQGALLQAVILDRAGYDVWEWQDEALMRAYHWMDKKAKTRAEGDDSWQPFLVNHYYDTNLPTQVTSAHGKNIAPTDWTHPDLDRRIWISTDELAKLPASGSQWNYLMTKSWETNAIDLSDQLDKNSAYTMAEAIVYARTGNEVNRSNVITACMAAIGSEDGGRSLDLGSNLGAVVMAADLIGLPYEQDLIFRDWLKTCLTNTMSDGRSLIRCHEQRPNFWGTLCGGSRAAVAVYLRDWDELDRVAQVFKGWLGDTNSYNDFTFDTNLTWQADQNNPVGINPMGATLQGYSVDGVLPDDQRQGGSFTTNWPPPQVNSVYEALQGALMQAVILHRAGYDVWNWEDRAILRAYTWLHDVADFPAEGDDEWQPFIINLFYGTNFPTAYISSTGKSLPPTCWTHQKIVEVEEPDYSSMTIIGNSLPGDWRPFADTSPWNTPIPTNVTVYSNSVSMVDFMMDKNDSNVSNDAPNIRLAEEYCTPIWVVNSSNAIPLYTNAFPNTNLCMVYMNSTGYIYEAFDTNRDLWADSPIPLSSTMWSQSADDGQMCIMDPFKEEAYEMSRYYGWTNDPPECTTFNIWDLNECGYGIHPSVTNYPPLSSRWQAQGGKGSGFPLIAGVVRPEEVLVGEIRHALAFSFSQNRRADNGSDIMMYPPACRSDGEFPNTAENDYPVEGMCFQLNPDLDEEDFTEWGLTEEARIVARALQKYGMYLDNNGGDLALAMQQLGATPEESRAEWEEFAPGFYNSATKIPFDQFRAVYTSTNAPTYRSFP